MSFELIGEQHLPELQVLLQAFRHPCGLEHFHVVADDPESAFAIAFPTPPDSNDGRAHILEHLVLAGSQRYPEGHTFQAMTQRSLASFMNAMTYSERTVYPFSTPDRQDFENLLSVYLDATFFPLLRLQDFQQEGWRHVLRAPEGPLGVDGVVYNEMKGGLADRDRVALRQVMAVLLAGTPYAFESGGEPLSIPDLTHEALVAFHQQHYHPSQALAFSYGQFDASLVQASLQQVIDGRTDPAPTAAKPSLVSPLTEPARATVKVPQGEDDEAGNEHSFIHGWVLGPTFENDEGLIAAFMSQALVGGDAAVMFQRMSQLGFGRPSELSGADTENHEAALWVGMDGLSASQVSQAEALIAQTLEEIAEHGLPKERLEAVFREMEVMVRDVGNHIPLGVEVLLAMVPAAMAGANPAVAIDPAQLTVWEERLTDPAFVAQWVRQRLLNNPRQARITLEPSPNWNEVQEAKEQALLEARLESWSQEQRQQAMASLAAFEARSEEVHDVSSLPIIDLSSIDPEPVARLPHVFTAGTPTSAPILFVPASTRGIGQAAVYVDLSTLDTDQLSWVNAVLSLMESMGLEGSDPMDWMDAAHWRSQRLQGMKIGTSIFAIHEGLEDWLRHGFVCGHALERHNGELARAVARTFLEASFEDVDRLLFLMQEQQDAMRSSMASFGNRLAGLEGAASVSVLAHSVRQANGRPMLAFVDWMVKELETNPQHVVDQLKQAHRLLLEQPRLVVGVGGQAMEAPLRVLAQAVAGAPAWRDLGTGVPMPALHVEPASLALTGNTPVQFCHQHWPTVSRNHPDAPVLEVLADAFTNALLHPAIREQGSAYGVHAMAANGYFTVSSYRDPRLKGTFEDFEALTAAVKDYDWSEEELHQAKLSTFQRLSAPKSPTKRASAAVALLMTGIEDSQRRRFRAGLLATTAEDLRRVAQAYLKPDGCSRTVFTSKAKAREMPELVSEPAWPAQTKGSTARFGQR